MNDEEWLNKWKEFYKPFNVGDKLLVKPVWEEVPDENGRIIFNINPGHVFGTGLHQTTQLCMVQLEKYAASGAEVLDLGCGSGILSIVSLLLGAEHACAVDIDANAVKTAYENAELNGIGKDRYYVVSGNVIEDDRLSDELGYEKYDIVVANIIADVIIAMSSVVAKKIKKSGVFIASGIIRDRVEDVYEALRNNGFEIIDTSYKDEWISVTSRLSPGV